MGDMLQSLMRSKDFKENNIKLKFSVNRQDSSKTNGFHTVSTKKSMTKMRKFSPIYVHKPVRITGQSRNTEEYFEKHPQKHSQTIESEVEDQYE